MATTTSTHKVYLAQARACKDVSSCMSLYDQWAATYNAEVGDAAQEYVAPQIVAKISLGFLQDPKQGQVLDAGCGTGLVGQALAAHGVQVIDGLDLSQPMLDVARQTGDYRHLSQADMTKTLAVQTASYDVVTCVGTFTSGHVGPDPALGELVRVTKPGGIVVSTILGQIWEPAGFKDEVAKLVKEQTVSVVAEELVDYVKGRGDKAVLLVLRKGDSA